MNHTEDTDVATSTARGVTIEQDGYLLGPITAPSHVGTAGLLTFTVVARDGAPLTSYRTSHEQQLHLVVVRSDGTHFRHVHPTLDADGLWSVAWTWEAAGTYRAYADFVPADLPNPPDVTVSRTVEVGGSYDPVPRRASRTSTVDSFEVRLDGDLQVGSHADLTATITQDGRPVTRLQPYLAAFGHLVVLREGDLAFLHVHPTGGATVQGDLSGPTIAFMSQAPTAGRYLLYLDFQVDGQVHTATFTLDATVQAPTSAGSSHARGGEPPQHA